MENTVYEPREDSYLLQKYVEMYCKKGFIVLDMGTGSGIQGMTAAKKAKKVISCDINPDAVKSAKENASIERIKNIKFIDSDLFYNIPKLKFDLIVFNPPYLPEEKEIELENKALFSAKRGTETTVNFLDEAGRFLKEKGAILLIGSSLASWPILEEAIKRNLFEHEILEKEHVFFEDIFVFSLKKSEISRRLESLSVKDAKFFAKGKRGVVIKGIYKKKKVAIKVKKKESYAMGTIMNEARFLQLLNKKEIGPKVIMAKEDFLMYEFVEGEFIFDFVKKANKKNIITVLKRVFEQMHILDSLGINKFEMHHPIKHIIVDKNKPVLIDFERARYTEDPKNVTQFCDFLIGEDMNKLLKEKGIIIEKDRIIGLAREYKNKINLKNYKNIIKLIN